MKNFVFKNDWEIVLGKQFLVNNKTKKKAYICSPLRADTLSKQDMNSKAARAYMYYGFMKLGYKTRAPHAYLPALICESVPIEREMALRFGLKLIELSDVLLVCGDKVSCGMIDEIIQSVRLGLEIFVFNEKIFPKVKMIVNQTCNGNGKVHLSKVHEFMGLSSKEVCDYLEKSKNGG